MQSHRHSFTYRILPINQYEEDQRKSYSSWKIFAMDLNDGENKNETTRSLSGRRVGGRKKAIKSESQMMETDQRMWENLPNILKKFIPALVLLALVKSILSFLFGSPSVVYYQSTVYESSSYNADGKLEKIRKESFKSNIPGFVDGKEGGRINFISDRNLMDSRFMND
jgi:hypothetical protein